MLPTPSTSHINTSIIYPPSEDSYLLLDTLSSTSETQFLTQRFTSQGAGTPAPSSSSSSPLPPQPPPPLILEIGTGSGVVVAFLTAHTRAIFGRGDVLILGGDVNMWACEAAHKTIVKACFEKGDQAAHGHEVGGELKNDARRSRIEACVLDMLCADLTGPIRKGEVDVLVFNPPYVPSENLPGYDALGAMDEVVTRGLEQDAHLLSLSYEGGVDGMEVTNRLLEQLPEVLHPQRGVAYVLLCQQNIPAEVMEKIKGWGEGWGVEVVGRSGKQAGWERLVILKIYRVLNGGRSA